MSEREYYEVLGCSKEDSHEDIKRAYHEQILRCHPDKMKETEQSATKFHQIQKAWKILSNSESRKLYDAELKQAKLDEESILLYARITSDELYSKDENLAYRCRCGSVYIVEPKDLENYEQFYVPCEECTFFISIEVNKQTLNCTISDRSKT